MGNHFNWNVKIIPVLWGQWVSEQSVDTVSSRDVNGEAVWKHIFSWWNPYLLWKSGRLSVRGESSAGFHFDKEEIIDFLSEKEKLAVEIRSGVYDRLSEGGGMEMTVEASKGRRIRIYQLEQDSPFMMRFISLAEREREALKTTAKGVCACLRGRGGYLQSGRCLGEVWQKGAKGFWRTCIIHIRCGGVFGRDGKPLFLCGAERLCRNNI